MPPPSLVSISLRVSEKKQKLILVAHLEPNLRSRAGKVESSIQESGASRFSALCSPQLNIIVLDHLCILSFCLAK